MAITDCRITESEKTTVYVQSQPDVLVGTPSENKKVFDNYPELIANKHNQLVSAMSTSYLDESIDDSVVTKYKEYFGEEFPK